jgi:hypothetical protein
MSQNPSKNTIRLNDVKQALLDARFRDQLPDHVLPDVQKFLKNPGCACNVPIYRKILQDCSDVLRKYFPSKEYQSPEEEAKQLSQNYWSVINCHVDELETKLRNLPPGRKQLAIARHEDHVTVIVNELDIF